jgi:HNH endonuclease/AP2 domain
MLDQKTLRELFEYKEGNLYWKIVPTNNVQIGDKVGNTKLYSHTSIKGKKVYVHQIIFVMFHGYLPSIIDFKDCNPSNTRIENLREADRFKIISNSRKRKDNTSGYKGVSWYSRKEKWVSRITSRKKLMHLGYFTDKEEAYRAYCLAAVKYHGEFANLG